MTISKRSSEKKLIAFPSMSNESSTSRLASLTPSSRVLVESPLIRLLAESVGEIGGCLRAETDAKIGNLEAQLKGKMQVLEARIEENARLRRLKNHKVHDLVLEMQAAGADEEDNLKRQFGRDHRLTLEEVNELLREWASS